MEANLFAIPNYIKASSPEGLRRLMFKLQAKDQMQYKFDIIFANGSWFAWYVYNPKSSVEKQNVALNLNEEK